jgi:hypothetical protein
MTSLSSRRTWLRIYGHEDVLTVKHDVIPLDGADVFQQGSINSIGERVALAENSGDRPRTAVQAFIVTSTTGGTDVAFGNVSADLKSG